MSVKEKVRTELSDYLEHRFVEAKDVVLKDMKLINFLISSFDGQPEYTYDEYCQKKLELSLFCFDFMDLDLSVSEITDREEGIIHGRAVMRSMSDRSLDFEQIKKNEYIKFQADKISKIDFELFSKTYEYATLKMIWYKIPLITWKDKNKDLAKAISERAILEGQSISDEKRPYHEVWLSQQLFN